MPPANTTELLRLANDSGFPLQIAVERSVEALTGLNGWSVRYSEHAWFNTLDASGGFIDLVLQTGGKNLFLVVECKRVRDAKWLFLSAAGDSQQSQRAMSWVSNFRSGVFRHFGWHDVSFLPPTPEATFCAVRGQSTNDKNTLLERTGSELVSATEALAHEERDFKPANQPTLRFYVNVIVTTAELMLAKFNPDSISLSDGTIADATFEPVPFLRFRKQLSTRPIEQVVRAEDAMDYLRQSKQSTVFVVRAEALMEFLRLFQLSISSLSSYDAG